MIVQFEIDDDIARNIKGFIDSGLAGRLVFYVAKRRIVKVERATEWENNGAVVRSFAPTASGVFVVKQLTPAPETF